MNSLAYYESYAHREAWIALAIVTPENKFDSDCHKASGYIEVDENTAIELRKGMERRRNLQDKLDRVKKSYH